MAKKKVWPEGVGRRVLAEVDSTNAEAMRVARDLSGPTWILGLRQTAGRGRRGRPWADPEGNFAATLVMRPTEPIGEVALRSFVAALALYDALEAAGVRADLALKWPNDVLLSGGKLAGILLESSGFGTGAAHLAIGIGVNLAHTPDAAEGAAFGPVSLREAAGLCLSPEAFLDLLAPAYAEREAQFKAHGFARIRTDWLARAARLGEVITARTGAEEITGRFETVDAAGHLVLSGREKRHAIPAADVFFQGAADASGD